MNSLPTEIIEIIANATDAHPKHMISVLDIEDASGVAIPEAYKVFGCSDRQALMEKVDTLEDALNGYFDALCQLHQDLHPGGSMTIPGWPPSWKEEYIAAESTLRWLVGKVWNEDGDLMINDSDESLWEDLWTRMEAMFRSLPPWSNHVLKCELGIDLPSTAYIVDRTFGSDKMPELIAWFERFMKPIAEALETMDVQALEAATKQMERLEDKLGSYARQMQQHELFVARFVQR